MAIREVIFRGKRTDSGEWVYGYYTKARYFLNKKEMHIIFEPDVEAFPHCEFTGYEEVLSETIGQYTGLTDKNGKRIFEGDILDVSSDVAYGGVAVHRLGYFVVEFHNGCFMKSALDDPQLSFFDNAKRKGLYHFISTDIHKIVGNIYDNPEILKGGGGNG